MSQNKFVVYTVMVGGYDNILQPLVVDDRFDYVLFTDNATSDRIGVWQVRTFDYYNDDKTRLSRYPKMHPEELLYEYEASLYIDANIQIIGSWIYERFMELYEGQIDWSGRLHYDKSLYDHIYVVLLNGLETKRRCITWSKKLRKEEFPRYCRIFENNIIYRSHSENVKKADNLWWECYEKYSRRDQCILSYVFWRLPELKTDLLLSGETYMWDKIIAFSGHKITMKEQRSPYHSYPGYVQLRLMSAYSCWERWLNNMFYSLSKGNVIITTIIITVVSWLVFVFYAPVVYYKKYIAERIVKTLILK